MSTPVRMLTGTAAREDHTGSTTFVDLVPTPGEVFSTTQTATLTALFVTECRINTPGQHLEIRITVDGHVADPGAVTLTTESAYSTHSHLAFKTNVAAGSHTLGVQWRVSGGTGYVRNRSFTVWEVH
jgi:hypothetical protein